MTGGLVFSVTREETRLLKDNPSATAVPADQIGKVFYVLGKGMRQCLICDEVFTRQAAAEHAGKACFPSQRSSKVDGETTNADR